MDSTLHGQKIAFIFSLKRSLKKKKSKGTASKELLLVTLTKEEV